LSKSASGRSRLRKMIDDHLLTEEDIGDRVKVARIVQKLLNGALDLPDNGVMGLRDPHRPL
jgi:hypothetical protein